MDDADPLADTLALLVDSTGLYPHCEDQRDVVRRLRTRLSKLRPKRVTSTGALRALALNDEETLVGVFCAAAQREGRILAGRLRSLCRSDECHSTYLEWLHAKEDKEAVERRQRAEERRQKERQRQAAAEEGQEMWASFCCDARAAARRKQRGDPYEAMARLSGEQPLQLQDMLSPTAALPTQELSVRSFVSAAVESLGNRVDQADCEPLILRIGEQLLDAKVMTSRSLEALICDNEEHALQLLYRATPELCRVLHGVLRRLLRLEESSARYAEWLEEKIAEEERVAATERIEQQLRRQQALHTAETREVQSRIAFERFLRLHPPTGWASRDDEDDDEDDGEVGGGCPGVVDGEGGRGGGGGASDSEGLSHPFAPGSEQGQSTEGFRDGFALPLARSPASRCASALKQQPFDCSLYIPPKESGYTFVL